MSDNIDIRTMDFDECWNFFKTEIDMKDMIYRQVRFGNKLFFDINDYLKGRLQMKPKIGKVIIRGMVFDLGDFETELEVRERMMKNWLLENYGEKDIASARNEEYIVSEDI